MGQASASDNEHNWRLLAATRKHSGNLTTVAEFRRACDHRKRGQLPRIKFYFCEQPIPIPGQEELEQLAAIVKFRDEIETLVA